MDGFSLFKLPSKINKELKIHLKKLDLFVNSLEKKEVETNF